METQKALRFVGVGGTSAGSASKAICKCGEGYECEISTVDAGKAYYKCGDNCTCCCILEGTPEEKAKQLEECSGGQVYCKCDEGYTCVITKTAAPDAVKTVFECGQGCVCTA
ncbi:hypothetical protein HS088_TW16G00743 [Tripterygium wilfordii]|uniref:Uncharacterized protein n=1 Tax=Tripterygium wilfordii TaxID=458696 RepID=A0A7J7CJX6_TRIWF|nr:uncharacterized protein LOC119980557 [Tripterygium wilfordii]KAF5734296.1 hypothetical protein HS088_TW16G00743 [Tripterygium wilfordii]